MKAFGQKKRHAAYVKKIKYKDKDKKMFFVKKRVTGGVLFVPKRVCCNVFFLWKKEYLFKSSGVFIFVKRALQYSF